MKNPHEVLPAPAPEADVAMRYDRTLRDRLTQRVHVQWGDHGYAVHNRFRDFKGNRPSVYSTLRFPRALLTYLQAKRHPLLKTPLPFLSFDAIRFLGTLAKPGNRVLEVGGGNSTLWFLARGCEVTTIEHSPEWASGMRSFALKRFGPEVDDAWNLIVAEGADAIAAIDSERASSLDLLLVDSMNAHTRRVDAVRAGRSKVMAGGWLVLDNSDYPINWCASEEMGTESAIVFSGYAPMSLAVTETSFWQV